jgi:hypothetical protein
LNPLHQAPTYHTSEEPNLFLFDENPFGFGAYESNFGFETKPKRLLKLHKKTFVEPLVIENSNFSCDQSCLEEAKEKELMKQMFGLSDDELPSFTDGYMQRTGLETAARCELHKQEFASNKCLI